MLRTPGAAPVKTTALQVVLALALVAVGFVLADRLDVHVGRSWTEAAIGAFGETFGTSFGWLLILVAILGAIAALAVGVLGVRDLQQGRRPPWLLALFVGTFVGAWLAPGAVVGQILPGLVASVVAALAGLVECWLRGLQGWRVVQSLLALASACLALGWTALEFAAGC